MTQSILLPAAAIAVAILVQVVVRSHLLLVRLAAEAILTLAIGAVLLLQGATPLSIGNAVAHHEGAWLQALAVVWWLVSARLVVTLSVAILGRSARARKARLFSDLVAGGVYVGAALVVANSVFDLPVRGLIATSGVIAVVLGLALQNVLADLFSGIAVGIEQPFAVGDRVSVGDDAEGIVTEMNWRAVQLETDGGDLVTVPNNTIAKARLVNRDRPTKRRSATVRMPVRSQAPAQYIFALLRQAFLLCPDVMDMPPPVISIDEVGVRDLWIALSYEVVDSHHLNRARGQVLRQARRLLRHGGIGPGSHQGASDLLREMPLFRALAPDHLQALLDKLSPMSVSSGASLFTEGSKGIEFYVVRSGVLDVVREGATGRRSLGRIGPGGHLGVVSMMTGEPRQASVEALTDVELLVLSKQSLGEMLQLDPSLTPAIQQSARHLTELLTDTATQSLEPAIEHSVFAKLLDLLTIGHRSEE